MFQIDLKSRQSIYEQVVENIRRLVFTGVLQKDERLPSVRELSRTLTVNPNTVQKAYRELEHQGIIYVVSGKGCFVSAREDLDIHGEKVMEMLEDLKRLVSEMLYLGADEDRIRSALEEVFQNHGEAGDGK